MRCSRLAQLGLDAVAADQLLDAVGAGDPQHPAAADPAQVKATIIKANRRLTSVTVSGIVRRQ